MKKTMLVSKIVEKVTKNLCIYIFIVNLYISYSFKRNNSVKNQCRKSTVPGIILSRTCVKAEIFQFAFQQEN